MALRQLLCMFLFFSGSSFAAKILLLPADHKGHVNFFTVAGKQLQKRGHEVVILAQTRNKHIVEKSGLRFILNDGMTSTSTPLEDYNKVAGAFFSSGLNQLRNTINMGNEMTNVAKDICYEIIQNTDIINSLKDHKFDIALVDGVDIFRCLYVIPYKLDIKYITLTARQDPWVAGLPSMPSVEGMFGMFIMKKDSSYFEVLGNLALNTIMLFVFPPFALKDEQIKEMVPEKPSTSYQSLFKASEVFLINADNTCMDYPRIEAPHYRFIGGIAASPPKPLPKEFEQFIGKAENGLIVVSFGSLVKRAPESLLKKFLVVFKTIPQKVIMRYDGKIDNVLPNVMLAKWLPQNDLLGHPKTKLFIAHGGNNGQMEALYHGVPMIIMPFAADQMYSAQRLVDKQYGKTLDPLSFTGEEFRDALKEVLENPVYSKNMKKCSQISKTFPDAHESINFWVEHIVKFNGAKHLHPISIDMPVWRMFMLDVLCIITITVVLASLGLYKFCKCVYKRCCSKKVKVKAE